MGTRNRREGSFRTRSDALLTPHQGPSGKVRTRDPRPRALPLQHLTAATPAEGQQPAIGGTGVAESGNQVEATCSSTAWVGRADKTRRVRAFGRQPRRQQADGTAGAASLLTAPGRATSATQRSAGAIGDVVLSLGPSATRGSRSNEVGEVLQTASPLPLPMPRCNRTGAGCADACQGGRCNRVSGRAAHHGSFESAGGSVPESRSTAEAVGAPSSGPSSRGSSSVDVASAGDARGARTPSGGVVAEQMHRREDTGARPQVARPKVCSRRFGGQGRAGIGLPDGVERPEGDRQPAARQWTAMLRTRGGGTTGAARATREASRAEAWRGLIAAEAEARAAVARAWADKEAAIARAEVEMAATVDKAEAAAEAAVAAVEAEAEALVAEAEADADAAVAAAEAEEERRWWLPALTARTAQVKAKADRALAKAEAKAKEAVAQAEAKAEAAVAQAEAKADKKRVMLVEHAEEEAEAAVARARARAAAARPAWADAAEAERRWWLPALRAEALRSEMATAAMAAEEPAAMGATSAAAAEAVVAAAAAEAVATAATAEAVAEAAATAEAAAAAATVKPVVTPEVAGVATEVPAAAEAVTEAAAQPAAADEAEEGWTAAEMASAISSLFAGVLRPQAAQSVGAQLELLSSAQLSSARASPATLPAAQLSAPPSLVPAPSPLCSPLQGAAVRQSAEHQPCRRSRARRQLDLRDVMRRGERRRWRGASRSAARECRYVAAAWRGGCPPRGSDVRTRMQLQAHGEGPGRTRSGPTSILSRGQLEPNPAMIRG